MSGFTGIYLGDPTAAAAVQARGLDSVAASTGEVLGATAGSAWHESIGPRALDWAGRQFGEDSPMLDAEEATRRFGIPGTLKFDRPVSEATAGALRQGREAEQARQAIIARRPEGLATSGAARLAVSLGTAMLDPVNVGLALIPFVGEARMAALLGTTSRTAIRAATGAANGALGMAALEPADYALSRAEFNDRTMAQTLGNIAFGGVLGGGLHVLGGAAMDAVRGRAASAPGIATDFSGTLNLGHARLAEQGPLERFTAPSAVETRYDATGGVFGGNGVYLDNSGAWTGNDYGHMGLRNNYEVKAPFERAFVLSPATLDAFAAKYGASREVGAELSNASFAAGAGPTADPRTNKNPTQADFDRLEAANQHAVDGPKIVEKLRKEGYDGIIVQGFDAAEVNNAMPESLTAKLRAVGITEDILQDQVFHFNPSKVAVVGPRPGRAPQTVAQPRQSPARKLTPVERALGEAPTPVRDGMLQGAVAAVAEGRPVEVGSLMNLPTATSYRAVAGEAADGAYAAFTPGGLRVEARPEVVDLGSLIPSHMADGSVNPLYPHAEGLQPRDRSTAGSQDQIHAIAANLQPERLGPSPEAGAGAPIVDPRGVVESGNGRVAALERVYASPDLAHRAQAYRAYLEAQGHDLTGIERPVLVGRRVSDLSPQEAAAFAKGANERPNLAMSAAEQARADADRAGRAIDQLQPGQLSASQNRDFTRAFLAQLPAEERGSLVLADGRLSAAGEARIRAGMLAHAYGDAMGPLLERLLNGEVDNLKTIAGALADSAGPWGRMRAAAARGEIPPDLDITAGLGEAVQLIEQARRAGKTVPEILAQADAFAAPPGPATLALLRLMHRDEALTRPLSREALDELLARYTSEAMKVSPGPDLFGAAPAGPADLLRAAARHTDPEAATARALDDLANAPRARAEDVQASREVARMAQEPASISAPSNEAAKVNKPDPETAALTAQADEITRQLEALPLSSDEQATLARLREGTAAAEGDARAHEAAAMCMAGVR